MNRFKIKFFNISTRDFLGVFAFYLFFSWLYNMVLWYVGYGFRSGYWGWLDLRDYWFRSGMQYSMYFIASLIIFYLGVYLFRNKSKMLQMIIVGILIIPILYATREFRYMIVDHYGYFRLGGTGTIWDWYIPTLFLFIQFGFYFAYQFFKENQQKLIVEGALRQAALKSELSAIKAQLNPHFLYNVFNTINASLPPENEQTRTMIAELSDLFRYQLKASKTETVPLKEELDFVTKYLKLEKARFEDRLKVTINVAPELMCEKVPPMILQPIVENCVKHGISNQLSGGEVLIEIFRNQDRLNFRISDTGSGITDKESVFGKGVGLTNTKLRLEKMYGATLEILDNKPQGTVISFAI